MQKKYLVLQIDFKRQGKGYENIFRKWFCGECEGYKQVNKFTLFYEWLTDYFFYEDVYCYSEKEFFIDVTNYLELYQKTLYQLALEIKTQCISHWKTMPVIGIGTNLFLAKTACDIITREKKTSIAYLDVQEYIHFCSDHQPLTDFWQVSHGMMMKLKKLGITTMRDIRFYSYEKLYQEFGYNAEYLINHALGIEETTISDLNKKTLPTCVSSCSSFEMLKTRRESYYELKDLLDFNILKLKEAGLATKSIYVYIKYANDIIPKDTICIKLDTPTNSYSKLMKLILQAFHEQANLFFPIQKLAVSFGENVIISHAVSFIPYGNKKFVFQFFSKNKEYHLPYRKKLFSHI